MALSSKQFIKFLMNFIYEIPEYNTWLILIIAISKILFYNISLVGGHAQECAFKIYICV